MYSRKFFWSDLHLGHQAIPKFRAVSSVDENTEKICDAWNETVLSSDTIVLVGDIALSKESLTLVQSLPGRKILVPGNHDMEHRGITVQDLADTYSLVKGLWNHNGFWIQHSPMHPDELFGKRCIHGHKHNSALKDDRFVNVNVDFAPKPVLFEDIRDLRYTTHDREPIRNL